MQRLFRESPTRYRFHMTLDLASLQAALPGAVGHEPFDREETPDGLVYAGRPPSPRWTIRITSLPPLHLGALALPRLEVELDLAGHSAEEAEAFAKRFLSHLQRSGG